MKLSEQYTFPDHVLAEILAYDPALRVQWDPHERCIRVERRITRSADVSPGLFSRARDRQSAAERWALIYLLSPGQEHEILPRLHADDLWRRGGANQVMTEVEWRDAQRRAAWKQRLHEDHASMARDAFKHVNTVRTVPEGAGHRRHLGTGRGERLD